MAGGAGHGGPTPQNEKFFNTFTDRGRRNCTVASLGLYLTIFLYFKFRPSKQK